MAKRYFQKASWTPFVYRGETYSLDHLDEYLFTVEDTGHLERRIAVTFSDHCFTRTVIEGDGPDLIYAASERGPGYFCFDRYRLSIGVRAHIAKAAQGEVWTVEGDNYAVIPVVDHDGRALLYGIVFSLEPVKGLPVHLHMRVKTAYPCTDKELVTFGSVRFRHLVALRVQHKRPGRITGRHRRVPRLS